MVQDTDEMDIDQELDQATSSLTQSQRPHQNSNRELPIQVGKRNHPQRAHIPSTRSIADPDPAFNYTDKSPTAPQEGATTPKSTSFVNIFHSLLAIPELIVKIATHLAVDDLVSLYAISRDFHAVCDRQLTTVTVGNALEQAPESSETFRFKAFRKLCRPDPVFRPLTTTTPTTQPLQNRYVPSFRWLRMVVYRERVVGEIVEALAAAGHHLPRRLSLTLKRLWLTMDVTQNGIRRALMHNDNFWTADDLYIATMLIIKLDMYFADPIAGFRRGGGLRPLLMAQRSLTPMLHALLPDKYHFGAIDALQMYVRYEYRPSQPNRHLSIMGVPPHEVGIMCREGYGRGQERLEPPDDLIMKEADLRDMRLDSYYAQMMVHGYIDLEKVMEGRRASGMEE
ncbi:MAG: hypothetical protein M1825_005789 [Sarcosagium campestre]|nr:MAG: hypothetical protein M1825_005789 [Sarcosagium campestre]